MMDALKSVIVGAVLALMVLAVGGCDVLRPTPDLPPTEAEARAHLDKVVAIVVTGELSTLCVLASGTCPMELRNSDPALWPNTGPVVVGSEVVRPQTLDNGNSASGGRLLQLCGVDGANQPYYSEMLVFRDSSNRMISINTLYWLGARVGGAPVTAPAPNTGNCPE